VEALVNTKVPESASHALVRGSHSHELDRVPVVLAATSHVFVKRFLQHLYCCGTSCLHLVLAWNVATICQTCELHVPVTKCLLFTPLAGFRVSSLMLEPAPHIASGANVISMLLPVCPRQVLEYTGAVGLWAHVVLKRRCRLDA
jgi:hypothetical protein